MSARTDTVLIPIIDGDLADTTVEFRPPWLLPPVTRVYRTPRARLAHRWQRLRGSAVAGHLRASARSTFWPAVVCAGFVVGVLAYMHGHFIWVGVQDIPAGSSR